MSHQAIPRQIEETGKIHQANLGMELLSSDAVLCLGDGCQTDATSTAPLTFVPEVAVTQLTSLKKWLL